MLLAFTGTALVARAIGPADYGRYAWCYAWATLLQLIAVMGMDRLLVRTLSAYKAQARWGHARGLLRRSAQMVVVSSCICAGSAALVGLIAMRQKSSLYGAFLIGLTIIPFLSLTTLRQAAMQALGRVPASRIPDDIIQSALFIVFVLLLHYALGDSFTAGWALAAQGTCALVACVCGAIWLRIVLPTAIRAARSATEVRTWIRSALPLWWVGSISVVLTQADIILVGILAGTSSSGIYSVASRIGACVGIVEFAINTAFAPVVARLFALDGHDRLRRGAVKVTFIGFCVATPVAVFVALLASPILHVFGPSFDNATASLRWICLSYVISVAAGQNGVLLMMTGHASETARGTTIAVILNVALNMVLIPLWGVTGAGIAWAVTVLVWNGLLAWRVKRLLHIDATMIGVFRNWTLETSLPHA